MAGQVVKSPLAKMAGAVNAELAKRAGDSVKQGFSRLPGGIDRGVARLVECGFFEHDASTNAKTAEGKSAVGLPYFRAAGVVIEPETVIVEGKLERVKGLQTSIMFPVYATRDTAGKITSAGEHASRIADELGKLAGLEVFPERIDAQWLEAMATGLKQAAPYFRFSTSESKPQLDPKTGKPKLNPKTGKPFDPRVWENWNGVKGLEGYTVPSANGQVQDNTAAATEQPAFNEFENQGSPEGEVTTDDIDSLVAEAPDNEEARERLVELCARIGKTQAEVENADSWDEVGGWLKETATEGGAAGAPPTTRDQPVQSVQTEWSPVVGEVYKYQRIDPKTNKPVQLVDKATKKKTDQPPIEVEVIEVDTAKKLCKVGDLDSGKDKNGAFKKTVIAGWGELIR